MDPRKILLGDTAIAAYRDCADVNRGKRNPAESTLQLPPLGRGSFGPARDQDFLRKV